jgi:hypothetical protein
MEIYHCDLCDYETNFKSNLTRHKKVHLKTKEEPDHDHTICVMCLKQFSNKYKCKRHMEHNCKVARNVPNVNPNVPNVNPNVPNVNPDVPDVNLDVLNVDVEMPNELSCKRCYKCFSSQSTLNRHIEKKRCKSVRHPLECCKCRQLLSSAQAKSRHQKTCGGLVSNTLSVAPPSPLPVQQHILTQNNTNNNSHNTVNTNCHNNYTQHIHINNFGSESTTHVSKEFLDMCLRNLKRGVCDYIEKVNFNPDVPQNHNVRLEGARSVKVKEADDTWRLRNLEPTVTTMIKNRCRELETHYESSEDIKVMDTVMHFNIIRDHLQYLMTGVKKEVKPVFEHVVSLIRELENVYKL